MFSFSRKKPFIAAQNLQTNGFKPQVLWLFMLIAGFSLSLNAADNKKTILVFGDSLSAAYNIEVEKGWVSLLQDFLSQDYPQYHVVNASISGETTDGGLTRFEQAFSSHKPRIVVLELGGNDGLRGLSLTETQSNLAQMIEFSQKQDAKVLLAGIKIPPNYGRTYTQRFEKIYANLQAQYGVALIPFILEPVALQPNLMQRDGIHPTAEAQPLIAKHVITFLEPMLNP